MKSFSAVKRGIKFYSREKVRRNGETHTIIYGGENIHV